VEEVAVPHAVVAVVDVDGDHDRETAVRRSET